MIGYMQVRCMAYRVGVEVNGWHCGPQLNLNIWKIIGSIANSENLCYSDIANTRSDLKGVTSI